MGDLDDVFEVFDDIEDIVEELFDPEDLIEDFHEEPLKILFAFAAAVGAIFTVVMAIVLAVLLALRYGLFPVAVGLTAFGVVLTVIALLGFLYVRPGVPHRVQRQINHVRARSDESASERAQLTDEEAIERLREQYVERNITVEEFEEGVEEVLESDDPEAVVYEYEGE